jgi:hypothetical protein
MHEGPGSLAGGVGMYVLRRYPGAGGWWEGDKSGSRRSAEKAKRALWSRPDFWP